MDIEEKVIPMQKLIYSSEPAIILAIGRSQENLINYEVKSIDRYESSQGLKMVKYVCYCKTIYRKKETFYVNYGLDGKKTNISLSPGLSGTDFNA